MTTTRPVLDDTLKDIEFVIEPPAVDQVEDLSEDQGTAREPRHDRIAPICLI